MSNPISAREPDVSEVPERKKSETIAGKPEDVEDRPNVGIVKPEDYPEDQRAKGA